MADIFLYMLVSYFISVNSEKIAYHNGYKGDVWIININNIGDMYQNNT